MNFEDIRKDLVKVHQPWTVIKNTSDTAEVGMPADAGWKIVVTLAAETTKASVKVFIQACYLYFSICE